MQTVTQPQSPLNQQVRYQLRRRRFSPYMLIGTIVTLLTILGAGLFFVLQPLTGSHAAAAVDNPDCTLIVPAQPLTAAGLATPYELVATNPEKGACHEANKVQAAFVQGAVFDPATSQISLYNPLVVDKGKKPAVAAVMPNLPADAVVGLWFGFNGTNLTLKSAQNSLNDGNCVNGSKNSIFGQFAYCNAPAFFEAANKAIGDGKLVPPALGTAKDGLPCPTVRDFGVVDMDQSDNVTTTYLVTKKGLIAQMNAANVTQLPDAAVQVNGSDNRLLSIAMDGALGCKPWSAPDLADPGNMLPSLPLNELQAAAQQAAPMAVVPISDPMTKINNNTNVNKLNLYRQGVNQPVVQSGAEAATKDYCKNLLAIGPQRIQTDMALTKGKASPDAAAANNLFTFLAQRFNTTWGKNGLNCQGQLKQKSPIKLTTNKNGVVVNAKIKL